MLRRFIIMPYDENDELRNKIIGLGETSVRKSYYPQLQDRLLELERFHTLLDRSREMIILVEASNNIIVDMNTIVETVLGNKKNNIVGTLIDQWLPSGVVEKIHILKTQGEVRECCMVETLMPSPKGSFPAEFFLQCAKCGDIDYFLILGSDITERKKSESKIHTLAFYDALTNLPNRQLFMDRLTQALAKSERHRKIGAVMMIDLDNFKVLNDTKGHRVGDELLSEVAERIQRLLRPGDTVARLGGDEFVVLLESLSLHMTSAALESEAFAFRIKQAIAQPFYTEGFEYRGSSSIGITLFLGNNVGKESLLKHADIAMYQAKNEGRNTICYYDPIMQETIIQKVAMENELRMAIQNQHLRLYYQPQVDNQGTIIGLEALVRWMHPTKGLIPPNDFIPLAEETGLIIPLGEWVFLEACQTLALWQKKYHQRFTVSINISTKQFQEAHFYDMVKSVLDKTGVLAQTIKLELTESIIVNTIHEIIDKFEALRSLGLCLSLDDFGTGYSSLAYLKRLPLDELKIDQSFVRDITTDKNDAMLVRTIIDIAYNFDLLVVAEGVETKEQKDFLYEHGCLHYQGYLFGKPMPKEELERLLK